MAKGYIIARVRVDDMEQYKKYMALSPDAIAAFGGEFIIRGGQNVMVEGEAETRRTVVIEFPSYQAAKDCYESDIYQSAKKFREGAGEGQFLVIEGVE